MTARTASTSMASGILSMRSTAPRPPAHVIVLLTGSKPNFSTYGLLIRQFILKVSTFMSLGFGPVSLHDAGLSGVLRYVPKP